MVEKYYLNINYILINNEQLLKSGFLWYTFLYSFELYKIVCFKCSNNIFGLISLSLG